MSGIDTEVVRTYSGKVPPEIRSAVAPLSSDKAWAVFAALLTHESMRFTEVKSLFGTDSSGDISRHLKALTTAGLIERRAPTFDALGDLASSVYVPTALGRSLMRGLYTSVLPQPTKGRVISREFTTVALRRYREHIPTEFSDYSGWTSTKTDGVTLGGMTIARAETS